MLSKYTTLLPLKGDTLFMGIGLLDSPPNATFTIKFYLCISVYVQNQINCDDFMNETIAFICVVGPSACCVLLFTT